MKSRQAFRAGLSRAVAMGTITAAVGLALTVAAWRAHASNRVVFVAARPLVQLAPTVAAEADRRDADIALYERRVREDPSSAVDRLTLATQLYARARRSGSMADFARAETLAHESIALRSARNGQAFELLASAMMARHDFDGARRVAARVDSLEPGTPSHVALLGEIELELGQYDAAAAHFRSIRYDGRQFTIGARLARWYELTGQTAIARSYLHGAIIQADRRDDLPAEQAAWFHFRLGDLELRTGNFAAADTAYRASLARNPDDVRALGGMARLSLATHDYRGAVEYGERATAIVLDPTTLGVVSEAYAALGDSAQSARAAQAMAVSALVQPGEIHRAWGLFLLDHGTRAERREVLRRATHAMRTRRDVYGYDLYAWALWRNGDSAAAREAMQHALAQRTEDLLLTAHASAMHVVPE